MNKVLILFISLFCIVQSASSEEYYIDYENGNDTNTGTNMSSAFRHSPGDINAANNPAGIELKPGDIVHFKGGVLYHGTININWSGAAGYPIVYDGNSSNSWGIGKAVITGDYLRYNGFSSTTEAGIEYIDIKHF